MRIFVNEFCGHPFQLELSRELANRGHDVCHVFFADNTSTPKGRTHRQPGDSRKLEIEGLHIRGGFSKYSLLKRRQADIEYGTVAADKMKRFQPDMVLSANMPLDGQKVLQEASCRQGAKFVFWMQDVYSMAVRFVLSKKAPYLAQLGQAYYGHLERHLLQRSDAIICIAQSFKDFLFEWGIPENKMYVIDNWATVRDIVPTSKRNAWAMEHGVADRFCFLYSGTLGMKHRPELLLELGRVLQSQNNAHLIVIAGGAGADWLATKACELRPGAITLLPFQPYDRLSEVMGSADVLITLLDSEAGEFAIPSKVLSYLCSGRALIVGAPRVNEAAKIVERANAGVVISADSTYEIVQAARRMMENPFECCEYGKNGRTFAERAFAIESIADRFLGVFASCIAARRSPQPAIDTIEPLITAPGQPVTDAMM